MADTIGGAVSAPGDPDTESDDGGELALLDLPLPTLFARGAAIHRAAQEGTIPQAHLADGVATLRRATEAVRQLGLFSRNEEADDVATGELKYLLLPFLLAQVLVNLQAEDRTALLTEGQQCLEHFLLQCESYGLVPANAKAVRERVEPVDPGTARAEKIARFKRDKEITAKLDAIEQRMANRRGRSARDGDDAEQSPQADDDEEDERAAWLLRIQSAVYKAIDLQPLLATEAALLASRPVVTPQMNAATQAAGGEPRATAPSMVVIDSLSRVSLTSERERMRGEVFRPSHILPTMTIEQFGELEYQRMVTAEAARQKAESAARDAAAGTRSDDEAEEDAKLAKARSWDDWKDDHKFGSGNSRLRPCGR